MSNVSAEIRHLIDSFPTPMGIKGENSEYLYVNQLYADIVNIKKAHDVIGLTVADLPTTSSRNSSEYMEQDLKVMQSGKLSAAYCLYRRNDDELNKLFRFTKSPYLDLCGKTKGVIFCTEEFTSKVINTIGLMICGASRMGSTKKLFDIKGLTAKEQDVLFYSIQGKTAKQISKLTNISPRMINDYLRRLREHFNVNSVSDLQEGNLNLQLPQAILQSDVSLLIEEH